MSDTKFVPVTDIANPTRYLPHILQGIYDSSVPYAPLLFGSPDAAREVYERWMLRDSSELSVRHVTLLFRGENAIGGHLGMSGVELETCRKADMMCLMKEFAGEERRQIMERLQSMRGLLSPPRPDEYYSSRAWLVSQERGKGLATLLVQDIRRKAQASGLRRIRGDIYEKNVPWIKAHERAGYQKVSRLIHESLGEAIFSILYAM